MAEFSEIQRFPIHDDLLGYLMQLFTEREALRALNCQLIRAGDTDTESYTRFLQEYKDACLAWNIAYDELVKGVTTEMVGPNYKSEISFLTAELIFYKKED